MRILMVCLGNICRSPLAEGILRSKVASATLDWEVDSAGTGSWHVGEPPDPRSVAIARKYGLDISDQRARQFHAHDFDRFDRIYAMDQSNYQNVLRLARKAEDRQKVRLILDELDPASGKEVPDPYWDNDGFDRVFQMLDRACDQIIP